jgi:hypothetical protein
VDAPGRPAKNAFAPLKAIANRATIGYLEPKMKLLPAYTWGLSLLILVMAATPAAGASHPTLSNITVSNTSDDLVLHLNLEGSFAEFVRQNVLTGKTTSFTFRIQLSQVQDFWLDHKIADLSVIHTIKFDNLKKEFTVRRSWAGYEAEVTPSFEEAQRWMNQIAGLKIVPVSRMERGTRYELRAKAEVSKKTLPLNLHHVLFFVSFWDEQTDWYIIDFVY